MREHLDRAPTTTTTCSTPTTPSKKIEATADALDAWYAGGRVGDAAAGPAAAAPTRAAGPVLAAVGDARLRLIYDPDGRPWRKRMRRAW